MKKCIYFSFAAFLAIILMSLAHAEDRALLIGVGKYQHPKINLPGIDKDITMMKEVADLMGFSQIKILRDNEATLNRIEQAIEEWLVQKTTKNDRVLIYFTGHGSQIPDTNGDEKDNVDEVLLPHDMHVQGKTLVNTFVDDKFSEYLNAIKAGEIFVFIDACHSGTAIKAMSSEVTKFFQYPGVPLAKENYAEEETSKQEKYISLSACQDNEESVATGAGSLFTRGILDAARKASKNNAKLTIKQLRPKAETFIRQHISDLTRVYHPNIFGDKTLEDKNLLPGIWSRIETLADNASYKVSVRTNQERQKLGDLLVITCEVKKDGYLNILSATRGDNDATVLFPNKYHKDNYVKAGTQVAIPSGTEFKLPARPPAGRNIIAVFHTKKKIDVYQGKDPSEDLFMTLSEHAFEKIFKDYRTEEKNRNKTFGAGKIFTYVEE